MTAFELVAAWMLGQTGPEPAAARPPNVVVLLTDVQGWADLGCQESRDIRSPRIDKLAAEGSGSGTGTRRRRSARRRGRRC